MKNSNKKISSMLLTGMIMTGGFITSGLNAHANTYTPSQEKDIQRVKFCCKNYGDVYVMNSKEELDDAVKNCNRSQIANNGHLIKVKSASEIPTQVQNAKRYHKELVEVSFHDVCYLIDVK